MKYEVNEKKLYKIADLTAIEKFDYEFKHLETTFELEKYLLEVVVNYTDTNSKKKEKKLSLPIALSTTMTEQLVASVKNINFDIKSSGIELDLTLEIDVEEIEENIDTVKEEIKDNYQVELEEKLTLRDEEENDLEVENSHIKVNEEEMKLNLGFDLKTDYSLYKVLSLDDSSLDKISAKYSLSMDYLYEQKKNKNKVIVYVKE